MKSQNKIYIGVMTGTSIDGLDIAAIEITQREEIKFIASETTTYPFDLRQNLLAISLAETVQISSYGEIDTELGKFIGKSVINFLRKFNIDPKTVEAIGSHGQTIRHNPPRGSNFETVPFTLQIGDPNQIAHITQITTTADFRRMDMAAGGQGAPLVPLFHEKMLGNLRPNTALVNIGGISNITLIEENLIGYDIGPGNCLLDAWCQEKLNKPFDKNGSWARTGNLNRGLLEGLMEEQYFGLAPPKSTGRELFNLDWLKRHATDSLLRKMRPQDIQRTLLELTAVTIKITIQARPKLSNIIICGGGRKNKFLMERLYSLISVNNPDRYVLDTSERWEIDGDCIESAAFAWLAFRRLNNLPGASPAVTGARSPSILGAVYTP